MFEIRTNLNISFGSLKDLHRYMQEEEIEVVNIENYWTLEKLNSIKSVTIQDIEKILRDEKEIDKEIRQEVKKDMEKYG